MRKSSIALAMMFAVLMTMAFPSVAAVLKTPHQNTDLKCASDEDGVWHFVNNQHEGATNGYIVVEFNDGTTVAKGYDKLNKGTMHFWIIGSQDDLKTATTYTNAGMTTQVPGNLVLSDSYCEKK